MSMQAKTVKEYYEAITVVDAERTLVNMNISDYPHVKEASRSVFLRDIEKKSQVGKPQTVITTRELARKLDG